MLYRLLSLERRPRLPQVKIEPVFKARVDHLQEIENMTSHTNRLMAGM